MKKTILFSILLMVIMGGSIFILYKVFQDVSSWGDEPDNEVVENEVKEQEKQEQEQEEPDKIILVTTTPEVKKEENKVVQTTTPAKTVNKSTQTTKQSNTNSTPTTTITTTTNNLTPVVKTSLNSCGEGQRLQCWDNLSCNENGAGYGSPALWTANNMDDLPPVCGQWAIDESILPTSWSCCCGYTEDWQEAGGGKKCYSPVYTAELMYQ